MNKNARKVSIVLPVYNQGDLISEAIDSILNQTYSHIELKIINDGSTDEVLKNIEKYKVNKNIEIITTENCGLSSALNLGFSLCTGNYYTWTSADNILHPAQIEMLMKALEDNPDKGFVYSDYYLIGESGEPFNVEKWHTTEIDPQNSRVYNFPDANYHSLASHGNFIGASFLWRSEVFDAVAFHDETINSAEDFDFHLKTLLCTEFIHIPEPFYYYRVHGNTISALTPSDKTLSARYTNKYKNALRRLYLLVDGETTNGSKYSNLSMREPTQYKQFIGEKILFSKKIIQNKPRSPCSPNDQIIVTMVDDSMVPEQIQEWDSVAIAICKSAETYKKFKPSLYRKKIRTLLINAATNVQILHAAAQVLAERHIDQEFSEINLLED